MKPLRDRALISQSVPCQCSEPSGSSFIDTGAADVSMPVHTDDNVCLSNSDQTHPAQNFLQETVEMTHDTENHVSPLTDSVPTPAGRYGLRPRQVPRVTSGWSGTGWTNSYHTDGLDLK